MPFALPTLLSSPPQHLHTSFTTAADNFFRFLHSLASHNSFLNKILSLPSEFHTLCVQVRNSKLPLSWYFLYGKDEWEVRLMYNVINYWWFGFRLGSKGTWGWFLVIISLPFCLGIRWQGWWWRMGFWISWTFTTLCSLLGLFWHGFPTLLLPLLAPSGESAFYLGVAKLHAFVPRIYHSMFNWIVVTWPVLLQDHVCYWILGFDVIQDTFSVCWTANYELTFELCLVSNILCTSTFDSVILLSK